MTAVMGPTWAVDCGAAVNYTVRYRGMPVLAGNNRKHCRGSAGGGHGRRPWHIRLPEGIKEGCRSPGNQGWRPNWDELFALVRDAFPVASLAGTPANSFHDHLMLAGAVAVAVAAVPEPTALNLEVGSFAGHTAVFQAAVLRALKQPGGLVHAVDASTQIYRKDWGMARNLQRARDTHGLDVISYPNTSKQMRPWRRPLRVFFEDSKHNSVIATESFDTFEDALVEGGVVVMHDVLCAQHLFRTLRPFVRHRIELNPKYREITFPIPASCKALPNNCSVLSDSDAHLIFGTLNASLMPPEDMPGSARIHRAQMGRPEPCQQLCHHHSVDGIMKGGYMWAMCPNVRVWQKLPTHPVIEIAFEAPAQDGKEPRRRRRTKFVRGRLVFAFARCSRSPGARCRLVFAVAVQLYFDT